MHVHNRGDSTQRVFARLLFIVHERLRQLPLVPSATGNVNLLIVLGLVDAIRARFNWHPREQLNQPTGSDGSQLWRRLCGVG